MSKNLYYIPVYPEPEGECLSDELKYILRDHYALGDGPSTLTHDDIQYLTGLSDGGVADADQLVSAVESSGKVKIWLE